VNENTSYVNMAYVYDALTEDVEYSKRVSYVKSLIDKHLCREPDYICDLGCGTGTVCRLLADAGYECIGIDSSEDMLSVASQKNNDNKIMYLNQDITEFELYGTVDVFISLLDTINYLTEDEDLNKLFALVSNYLNYNGVFIFDINTLHKFQDVLGNNTYVYEKDNIFYSWENYFEDEFLDFNLEFFVKENDNLYRRFTEQHTQRYYSLDMFEEVCTKYGLSVEAVYSDLSFNQPSSVDERVFLVVKKISDIS